MRRQRTIPSRPDLAANTLDDGSRLMLAGTDNDYSVTQNTTGAHFDVYFRGAPACAGACRAGTGMARSVRPNSCPVRRGTDTITVDDSVGSSRDWITRMQHSGQATSEPLCREECA